MIPLELLAEEIDIEFKFLDDTAKDTRELIAQVSDKEPNNIEKAAATQYLSQFYNGIENILKRIIKYKNIKLPKTESWHSDLLQMFDKNNPNAKISLFNDEIIETLNAYRKIRHVVRQGYSFQLDWQKLSIALTELPHFLSLFQKIIKDYISSI
ncbi:MAG: hypothetical protein ABSG15_05700 [FCB group bacterium]|jgi:hypothetical protein